MRIVVTGREGQVARALVEMCNRTGHEVVSFGRPTLDLTWDSLAIIGALQEARPDVIVSAAAFTAVDEAEDQPDLAFRINSVGAGAVSEAACRLAVPLVHLSTDYVFDGVKAAPYTETDAPCPKGVYGASKLAGESAVLGSHRNTAILRTSWVYSPFSSNFVKTMLRLAGEHDELNIVCDQFGNPTSAFDLADGILAVASNLVQSDDPDLRGIFHMSGSGDASWAEFAEAVFSTSKLFGGPTARVKSISAREYPQRAPRPADSRLGAGKLAKTHGVRLPNWRISLASVVGRLVRGHHD